MNIKWGLSPFSFEGVVGVGAVGVGPQDEWFINTWAMSIAGGEEVAVAGPTVVDEVNAHVVAVVDEFIDLGEAPSIKVTPGA